MGIVLYSQITLVDALFIFGRYCTIGKRDLSKNKMKIWNLEARPDLAHIGLLINNASPIRVSPSPLLARRALEGKVSPWMHLGSTSLRFTEDTVVISPAYPFQSHLANTNSVLDYAPSFVFVSFFKILSLWVAEIECFLFWVLCYGLLSAPWCWFSFLSLQGKIKELEEFFNFNFNFVLFFVNYVCGVWFFIIYLFDYGCADIKSGHAYIGGEEGYRQDSDLQKAKVSREALTQLSKLVESRVTTGSVFLLTFSCDNFEAK